MCEENSVLKNEPIKPESELVREMKILGKACERLDQFSIRFFKKLDRLARPETPNECCEAKDPSRNTDITKELGSNNDFLHTKITDLENFLDRIEL